VYRKSLSYLANYRQDPIPTWLVKRLTEYLAVAPVICQLCNASLQSCSLPASQKHAVVQPRLKKASLNSEDVNSYRPISNLSFLSKFVERIVASRFVNHAESNALFPVNQSAYRSRPFDRDGSHPCAERYPYAADEGKVTALVLLDLSSAFDTVDHTTLLNVLERRVLVEGSALAWFQSYLHDRSQVFRANGKD